MANLSGFNANTVEPTTEFEAIPAGKYLAAITGSEMKPTKSGNGAYLELTFEVLEGEFKGRKLWARLNLENANSLTVKIARSELSAICRAIGVMEPRDSVELHSIPMLITVKQKARTDTGELTNEIRGYAKREAAQLAAPVQAATSTPPWRRASA
jgi:hypothetical protein